MSKEELVKLAEALATVGYNIKKFNLNHNQIEGTLEIELTLNYSTSKAPKETSVN